MKIAIDRIVDDIPKHHVKAIEEVIDRAVSEGRFECDYHDVWTNEINNSKYVVNSIRKWLNNLGYVTHTRDHSDGNRTIIEIFWY